MMDYKNISGNQQLRMDANLRESRGERRPGRGGVRLAPRSGSKETKRDVFGETPNTAVGRSEQHKSGPLSGLTALPSNRISEHSRLFESIRGCQRNSLICRKGLTQVVDFHDICRYFQHVLPLGERLAPRLDRKARTRYVFAGTPNTAVEGSEQHESGPLRRLTALPMNRISKHSRVFAFIRGCAPVLGILETGLCKSLISRIVSVSSSVSLIAPGQHRRNFPALPELTW
jgi:hypothetical protein